MKHIDPSADTGPIVCHFPRSGGVRLKMPRCEPEVPIHRIFAGIFNRLPESPRIRSSIKPAYTAATSFDLFVFHCENLHLRGQRGVSINRIHESSPCSNILPNKCDEYVSPSKI